MVFWDSLHLHAPKAASTKWIFSPCTYCIYSICRSLTITSLLLASTSTKRIISHARTWLILHLFNLKKPYHSTSIIVAFRISSHPALDGLQAFSLIIISPLPFKFCPLEPSPLFLKPRPFVDPSSMHKKIFQENLPWQQMQMQAPLLVRKEWNMNWID